MKGKIVILVIMTTILFGNIFTYKSEAMKVSPEELKRIDMLLNEKSEYVHEADKEILEKYKEKLKSYEVLSQEEKDYLRECYLNMIRNKLGEEEFSEYCKLIEKRSGKGEFTQPERFRLYELEKELRECR